MAETPETELLDLTTEIVAAHVSRNAISIDQIGDTDQGGPQDPLRAWFRA